MTSPPPPGDRAPVPKGRIRRALGLGRLGARFAVRQGLALVAADQGAAQRDLAATLAAELGRMKGLPMKVGQTLSYLTGVLPEAHRETWREALTVLRAHGPPTDPAGCVAVIEDELGAPVDQAFERFDPRPIASASIGQVFAARWEGRSVAVKVQYPGIAEAVAGDLDNMDTVGSVLRTVLPTLDTSAILEGLRARMREECDYRREAAYQRRFAELLASSPAIRVPEVFDPMCTERMLVTELVEGHPLEAFLTHSAPQDRYRAGQALFTAAFGPLLDAGVVHADPHPGNFLFHLGDGPALTLLDFGCVQTVDEASQSGLRSLLQAAVDGAPLSPVWPSALGLGEIDAVTLDRIEAMGARFLAPLTDPQPYTFDPAYTEAIAREVLAAKTQLGTRFLARRGRLELERPDTMMVLRTLFGLAHVWGELGATGPFRQLTRTLLDRSR